MKFLLMFKFSNFKIFNLLINQKTAMNPFLFIYYTHHPCGLISDNTDISQESFYLEENNFLNF